MTMHPQILALGLDLDHDHVETEQEEAPSAARLAVSDILPFAVALVPFSLAIGAAGAAAGLSPFESLFGAIALMAGASQLAAIDVMATGGGIAVTVAVVALINLRFAFYGTGMAQWFREAPIGRRLFLTFPVVDATFMLCQERFGDDVDLDWRQRYYLTATAVLITVFLSCQIVAHHIGAGLPDGLGLGLAAPLAFGGMLAKSLKGSVENVAAFVAAALVVIGSQLLGPVALPIAAGLGVLAGMCWGGASS